MENLRLIRSMRQDISRRLERKFMAFRDDKQ